MTSLLENTISNEIYFVYGLIALVIILIIVIVIMDKRESRKKTKNLFDTLNMKIIADPYSVESHSNSMTEEDNQIEVVEVKQETKETNFQDLQPIPEVKTISSYHLDQVYDDNLSTSIKNINTEEEESYIETELEKTQAQIRVEEITNALKQAQIEEQIQEDKYAKFEEEQEKNAIISYNELKESFDRLYSENEKIQYLEDDEIPINIDELYQLSNHQEEKKKEDVAKIKLEDLSNFATKKSESKSNSTFKSSPLISPVYGIQKPPVQTKPIVDADIENANQFLQNLKELKNNLE